MKEPRGWATPTADPLALRSLLTKLQREVERNPMPHGDKLRALQALSVLAGCIEQEAASSGQALTQARTLFALAHALPAAWDLPLHFPELGEDGAMVAGRNMTGMRLKFHAPGATPQEAERGLTAALLFLSRAGVTPEEAFADDQARAAWGDSGLAPLHEPAPTELNRRCGAAPNICN